LILVAPTDMPDRRGFLRSAGAFLLSDSPSARPASITSGIGLPIVSDIDTEALLRRLAPLLAAAGKLGCALPEPVLALGGAHGPATADSIQRLLDSSCLADVHINPETRVKVGRGPVRPILVQHYWRAFLVKVRNESGTTASLQVSDAQARLGPSYRWLDLAMGGIPAPTLSGLPLEYHLVRLCSHDAGRREASLAFDVGQGTQDLGFRNEVPILFDCRSDTKPPTGP
jgi:hypothetical protein